MKNIKQTLENLIEIIDKIYKIEAKQINSKRENLKLINLDTLESLINNEIENGNVKKEKDIVEYIESIIID